MTEEEAKTKWCPFARVRLVSALRDVTGEAACNRIANHDDRTVHLNIGAGSECIGSACMAWRWREDWVSSAGTMTYKLKDGARLQGGCGLAGVPQ